jgi:hypothetical protein
LDKLKKDRARYFQLSIFKQKRFSPWQR